MGTPCTLIVPSGKLLRECIVYRYSPIARIRVGGIGKDHHIVEQIEVGEEERGDIARCEGILEMGGEAEVAMPLQPRELRKL